MTASKFRVWDGEQMHHYTLYEIAEPGNNGVLSSIREGDVMQYTGLGGAEGTAVYEGDIVEHVYADEPAVVEWSDWYPGFDLDNVQTEAVPDALRSGTVVGNKFQIPELLD